MANRRILSFFAIAPLWVAIMSGALSLVREFAATFYPGKIPESQLFRLCSWSAFVISGGWAWWIVHAKAERFRLEIEERTPSLGVVIYEALLLLEGKFTEVFINAEITNDRINAPSLVSKYILRLEREGQTYMSAALLHDLENFSVVCVDDVPEDGVLVPHYFNREVLSDVASTISHLHPVEANLPHRGWLHYRFELPDWPHVEVETGGTEWHPEIVDEVGDVIAPEEWEPETVLVPTAKSAKSVSLWIEVPRGNSASSIAAIDHLGHRQICRVSEPEKESAKPSIQSVRIIALDLADEILKFSSERESAAPKSTYMPYYGSDTREMMDSFNRSAQEMNEKTTYNGCTVEMYIAQFKRKVAACLKDLGKFGYEDKELANLADTSKWNQSYYSTVKLVGQRLSDLAEKIPETST